MHHTMHVLDAPEIVVYKLKISVVLSDAETIEKNSCKQLQKENLKSEYKMSRAAIMF